MRIECTRAEWIYLHALLIEGNNTFERYQWPNAECIVCCAKTGYEFIRVDLTFTDMEANCGQLEQWVRDCGEKIAKEAAVRSQNTEINQEEEGQEECITTTEKNTLT